MSAVLVWLRFALLFLGLCGLLYPWGVTALIGLLFPFQAGGSLLNHNGQTVGSALVGQPFSGERFFVGRPSAAGSGYDPQAASGSNLAVSNPALRQRAQQQAAVHAQREGIATTSIPSEWLTASGSGLDPHLSPAAIALQVPRVARARGLSEKQVQQLVEQNTQRGFLGNPRVNVLMLNLALEQQP